jgi:hypothetical protein
MNTYVLDYSLTLRNGERLAGTYRVSNCYSLLHAKIRLNDKLQRKHGYITDVVIRQSKDTELMDFLRGFKRY